MAVNYQFLIKFSLNNAKGKQIAKEKQLLIAFAIHLAYNTPSISLDYNNIKAIGTPNAPLKHKQKHPSHNHHLGILIKMLGPVQKYSHSENLIIFSVQKRWTYHC